MKSALEKLASDWDGESRRYHQSAKDSGLVDGAHPVEQTAYQSTCAIHAGVYQTCAHQLRELIKKSK